MELEVFHNARSWLLQRGQRAATADETRLETLLRMVLGIAICEAVAPSNSSHAAWQGFLAAVETRLRDMVEAGDFDPFAYDSKLLLLGAAILGANGHQAHGAEDFANDLGNEIAKLPRVPRSLSGEALVLSALGHCTRSGVAGLDPADVAGCEDLLCADGETVRAKCRSIAAGTGHGTGAPGVALALRRELSEALTVVALQSLRAYDLALAAVVLRTIGYLQVPMTRWLLQSARYLERQQHRDGRFGCFAATASKYGEMGIDIDADLHVPITVSCVWTLSELRIPGFRVFHLVPGGLSVTRSRGAGAGRCYAGD